MTNLTLSIDEHILADARKTASTRDTSVAALVRDYITALAQSQRQSAANAADAWLDFCTNHPVRIGKRDWTREELHDRS